VVGVSRDKAGLSQTFPIVESSTPLLIRVAILAALLFLGACASPEGPGSLESVSPITPQPVSQVQTAPLPGTVTAQPLGTPGAQPVQTAQPTTIQPGTLQPGTLQPGTLQPGTLSPAPGTQTTLQDFSRIDPNPVPGSDPFANQRAQTLGASDGSPTETLQDAVRAGLQPQSVAPALTPATPQWPRVSLAPITTAPEPQATQLFDAIDDATYRRGMQLAFFGDETAQFVVRSQVSAIPADQVTSVIYVFDIFDARGTLRHRVSGARSIPRSGPDGWALVDPNTVQLIADDVAGRMMQWLQQNPA
jgi:hypothetical protein